MPMIKVGTFVFYVRERLGNFWLVDDSRPEIAIRLHATSQAEAERIAWTLVNNH